jgi:hypothetical protein
MSHAARGRLDGFEPVSPAAASLLVCSSQIRLVLSSLFCVPTNIGSAETSQFFRRT